jgi:hypothetical protein
VQCRAQPLLPLPPVHLDQCHGCPKGESPSLGDELRRPSGAATTTQFEFITCGWTTNPNFPVPGTDVGQLRPFESVPCVGYFFVPPLDRESEPWTWLVPPAA